MTGLIRREDIPDGVPVTLVADLKHAALYAAAKRLGSQKALADALGVKQTTIGKWIMLKECPPEEPTKFWSKRRLKELEKRAVKFVGCTLDQLFPRELRDNVEFRRAPKRFEQTLYARGFALEQHAMRTRERLQSQGDPALLVEQEEETKSLRKIVDDAGLCKRERLVISRRYPSDGRSSTIEEVGDELGVTRERVRQIEQKAIMKLRRAAGTHWVPDSRRASRKPAFIAAAKEERETPVAADAAPEPREAIVIDAIPEPEVDHEAQGKLIQRASDMERYARTLSNPARGYGLWDAAQAYRAAGLTHLAEDIEREIS